MHYITLTVAMHDTGCTACAWCKLHRTACMWCIALTMPMHNPLHWACTVHIAPSSLCMAHCINHAHAQHIALPVRGAYCTELPMHDAWHQPCPCMTCYTNHAWCILHRAACAWCMASTFPMYNALHCPCNMNIVLSCLCTVRCIKHVHACYLALLLHGAYCTELLVRDALHQPCPCMTRCATHAWCVLHGTAYTR